MKSEEQKDDYQKTQSASSPGNLGEQANRNKENIFDKSKKSINESAQDEGLNEEKSAGDAGAFEGFENTGR